MAVQINEALNTLPVITYRWLQLNERKLTEPLMTERKAYTKDFIKNIPSGRSVIHKIGGTAEPREVIKYGVSRELVELTENNYNAGIYLQVPAGETVEEPVILKYALDQDNNILLDHNMIIAEAGSQVVVVVDYTTEDSCTALHSGTMQVYAKKGASVTIVKLQRMHDEAYHFDSNLAIVAPNAEVNFIQVELGSGTSVTNYLVKLSDYATGTIDSLYLGDGKRTIDLSYHMEHIGRRSKSRIQTRGALKDAAQKVFRGTIDFKRGARQSDGGEEEYALLLNKGVKSQAIPLLLCGEDDVIGQHAASSGQVDADKLFYLMSRGLSLEESTKLLVEASFRPILDKLPLGELQELVTSEIKRRLVR